MAKADEARVSMEALSNGGDDGRGLLRGWCEVWRGAWTEDNGAFVGKIELGLRSEEGGRDELGSGNVVNVMDAPLLTIPGLVLVEALRT